MIAENFVGSIRSSILSNWDNLAFTDYGESSFSYAQVGVRILWLHSVFQRLHIKKGDKIALIGKNSSNWGITYLAAITYGAVIVPILSEFHSNDTQYIINHSDSILLFINESLWENLDETQVPGLSAVFSLRDFSILQAKKKHVQAVVEKVTSEFQEKPRARSDIVFPEISNSDLAAIVYTSGTTSFSKGVMLQHNSLMANVKFAIENMHLESGNRILSMLPLAHSYGCAFEFLFPFVQAATSPFWGRSRHPNCSSRHFQMSNRISS